MHKICCYHNVIDFFLLETNCLRPNKMWNRRNYFESFMLKLLLLIGLVVSSSLAKLNATTNGATPEVAKGKLIFAQVLYRHGDRMMIGPYPNDPWKDKTNWPTGWGQLTNIGKEQHYKLGQWLRKRYSSILNSQFSVDDVYIRSTDVDRTLMSAQSNLAGLYPPVDGQVWSKDIAWQPIPVHTIPESMDNILAQKAPCPAYDYALSSLRNSPEFEKINKKYAYLYEYLTKYTGSTIDSLEAVQRINSTLFIESLYNKTLPEWTKKVYPGEDMTTISALTFTITTYTRKMARLKTGLFIKEVLQRFVEKANGILTPDRSLWVYSAHDITVANVLNSFKLFQLHSPPYTACILMELRVDDNHKPYVSIFYKNTTAEPLPMDIPGCGTACPLTKMFSLYKDILPVDWEQECQLSTMMMSYDEANIGTAMAILVTIIVVMLFLSYIIMLYYRRRSYRSYFTYSQMA